MTALAVIGAIALLRLAWGAVTSAIARVRAHRATTTQVGCTYWSLDIVESDPLAAGWLSLPPAADARSVITQRLPRGWVPTGRVIDVRPEVL